MSATPEKYALDANAFIQAKRRFYALDFCPGYWRTLILHQQQGRLCSVDRVQDELLRGGDDLAQWIEEQFGSTAFADTGLAPSTAYAYSVAAADFVGNTSASSAPATITTMDPDNVPPTVNITSPINGATVTGTVTIGANASDNVSLLGVTFQLNGSSVGSEDTSAPFTASWNTRSATNGAHTLTAVARDVGREGSRYRREERTAQRTARRPIILARRNPRSAPQPRRCKKYCRAHARHPQNDGARSSWNERRFAHARTP